jgi:PAS domain S-box-containing protein
MTQGLGERHFDGNYGRIEITSDLLTTVVERLADGVLVGPPEETILYANPAACSIFRTSVTNLRELGLEGIRVPGDPAWEAAAAEHALHGRVRAVLPMRRADGSAFVGEMASASFSTLDGRVDCVVVRDVTERARDQRRLAAYDEIAEALLAGTGFPDVLGLVVKHARIIFDALVAAISIVDGESFTVVAAEGPGTSELVGRSWPTVGPGAQMMTANTSALIDDFTAAAQTQEGRDLGVGPAMATPIVSSGETVGTLSVGRPRGSPLFGPHDAAEATQFALRAGVVLALGQARVERERRQQKTNEQLQRALETRIVIEQAKGFLAATLDIDTAEAFDRLRKYARSHSTDIHHVAARVLQHNLIL